MIRVGRRGLALVGTAVLTAGVLGVTPATVASARPNALSGLASATPFSQAQFASYATGSQVHLATLKVGANTLLGVEQAFSGVSVNSKGLGAAINDPLTGALVQTDLSSSAPNAYARGTGLEVGIGTSGNANQILLPGLAQSQAPPNGPPVTKTLLPVNIPGVLVAGVLKGIAATAYSPNFCPVGQPIAYGEGDAAGVGLLGSNPPLVTLSGNQTQTAQSQSRSDLVANPVIAGQSTADGTFGLVSTVAEHIAPVSINLGTGISVQVSVGGSGVNNPITLSTAADGQGHTKTSLVDTGTLTVKLVAAGVTTTILNVDLTQILGPNGLVVDANALPVVGPVLTLAGVTLQLAVAAPPKPIAGFPSNANATSAAFDLVKLNVGLGATQIAGLNVGHMEAAVDLPSGGIACTVPVAKTATPAAVNAGDTFVQTISVPSTSTALSDSTCDLTNIKVTDKIGVNSGSPTFTVGAISNGGVYDPTTKTITWANIGNYHPGDPPKQLTISISVPASSGSGVLMDTANVTAGLGNCNGGATGQATLIGNVGNIVISGGIILVAPSVGASGGPLARTGGAGPMIAWIGAALLAAAEVTRRMVRRARQPELS
jgi:hypothetical protein